MGTTKATKTPKTPKTEKVTRRKLALAEINDVTLLLKPVLDKTIGTEFEPTIRATIKKLAGITERANKRSEAVVKNAEKKLAAIKKQVEALRAAGVEVNL